MFQIRREFSQEGILRPHDISISALFKNLLTSINPLMPELNPSAKRCLTRLFTGDFAY
jgi:hypothetical protein